MGRMHKGPSMDPSMGHYSTNYNKWGPPFCWVISSWDKGRYFRVKIATKRSFYLIETPQVQTGAAQGGTGPSLRWNTLVNQLPRNLKFEITNLGLEHVRFAFSIADNMTLIIARPNFDSF